MQRLAGVRVWSYIAARADWVQDSAHWQGRAREVEDLLSDALHERLTSRFVDRRAAHLMRRLEAGETEELLSAVTRRGEVVVEGHPVGHDRRLQLRSRPGGARATRSGSCCVRPGGRCARRCRAGSPAVEAAPDGALAFGDDDTLAWDGVPIARLRRGRQRAASAGRRCWIANSSTAHSASGCVSGCSVLSTSGSAPDLAPLLAARRAGQRAPGISRPAAPADRGARPDASATRAIVCRRSARAGLKAIGVKAGRFGLFIPAVLKPRAAAMRASLVGRCSTAWPVPELPPPDLVSLPRGRTGRLASPTPWAGWRPVRCCCGSMSPSGSAAELAWATRRGCDRHAGGAGVAVFDEG